MTNEEIAAAIGRLDLRLASVEGTVRQIWQAIVSAPGAQPGVLEIQRDHSREIGEHESRLLAVETGQLRAAAAGGNLAKRTWWEVGKSFMALVAGAAAGWLASGVRPPGSPGP